MSTLLAQSNWPACHSALKLDRYLQGELAAAEAEEIRAHVEACSKCAPALAALREAAAEALPPLRALAPIAKPQLKLVRDGDAPSPAESASRAPAIEPARSLAAPARNRWRTLAAFSSGLAAAAVALLVFRPVPAERIKGAGFALGMYVQHGDQVRRAGPGDEVRPGDAVRFSITAPQSGFAAVLSRDPAGRASIYFPLDERAAPVQAGADVPLPLSTRLDETVGEEQLVGLFCERAIELAPVRASLERGALQLPNDCQVARWSFVKH